jgi:hypothetical protein
VIVPLEVVPHAAWQLPPGRPPPPAAFFLVEQLLRAKPSGAAMDLALKLLERGLVPELPAAEDQVQGQPADPQHSSGKAEGGRQLQQLAYCSLASSLVQAVVHDQQLANDSAAQLWALVGESVQAAAKEVAAQDSSSSRWSYPASLAAGVAAAAYTAHLGAAGVTSACPTTPAPQASSSSSISSSGCAYAAAASSSTHSSSGGACAAGAAGCCAGNFPSDCGVCCCAIQALCDLRCVEVGVALREWTNSGGAAAFVGAAQRHSVTLHQHLQQQLLALAWRHPVPGVCGNVLCGRLEGSSAVCGVRGPKGTLCGRCKVARYCCEECQRPAWEAHREVCVWW